MTIITQDGRKLDVSRKYHLHISGYYKTREHKAVITATKFTKKISTFSDGTTFAHGGEAVMTYGTIGEYATDTGMKHVADMLWKAWENGAEEFTMPQDAFKKSAFEELEDFCQENGLIMAGNDELGVTEWGKTEGKHLAQTSDYWERHNIIVSDDYGDYSASLAKWKALQPKSA